MTELDWPLPVMQAPIGPATTPELVAAVSSTGGLGCLAASWSPLARLREDVRSIARSVERPFCVNLVLAFDQEERLELLAEEQVPLVSFSWGAAPNLIRRAHSAGATVLVQVGSLEEGRAAAAAGADVLIAQGAEAGGHVQSRLGLHELLSELREALPHPLIAAGGIAEERAAAAAFAAGADAIAAGTAFLAAREADVHPAYRRRVIEAGPGDTVLTQVFDIGWPDAPHRVIRNETVMAWEAAGAPAHGARPGEGDLVATRAGRQIVRYSDEQPTTSTEGDAEAMALYAGRSVDGVTETDDAASIVLRIAAGAPSAAGPLG